MIQCPILGWDLPMIFWASPKGLYTFSGLALCCTNTCVLGSSWLLFTPNLVLVSHPLVPVSSKCWGLLQTQGCIFTNSVSWAFFKDTEPATQYQTPMTPSNIPSQHHIGDSYTTKFGCQQEVWPWPYLEHSSYVLTFRNHFFIRFHLNDACLIVIPTISQLLVTSTEHLRKTKFAF